MSRIHRKTPKGLHEIETRSHGLTARMRSALILVDGRRSDETIIQLLGPKAGDLLVELAWQNYIERVDPAGLSSTRPLPSLRRPAAGASWSSPSLLTRLNVEGASLMRLRQQAARRLTDRLGPFAQSLAQRMEEADSAQDLEPLLEKAAVLTHNMLGAEAEAAYRADLHQP